MDDSAAVEVGHARRNLVCVRVCVWGGGVFVVLPVLNPLS